MTAPQGWWRDNAGYDPKWTPYVPGQHFWLTQVGGTSFREEPRWHKEMAVSVITGRLEDVEKAIRLCYRRPRRPSDRVRFFRIPELLDAEYLPYQDPHPNFKRHGAISAPIAETSLELHQLWWANSDRVRLKDIAVSEVLESQEGGSDGG